MAKSKKENNRRRFPGESNKNRPDQAAKRRQDALDRTKAYSELTPQQKLQLLDERLGVNQGAKKQRARLLQEVQHAKNKKSVSTDQLETTTISSDIMAEIELINNGGSSSGNGERAARKKKIKAKERRAKETKQNQ